MAEIVREAGTPDSLNREINRRTFVKQAGLAGAALLGTQLLPQMAGSAEDAPNILVVIVDQLRAPQWFPDERTLDSLLPAFARLRKGAVNFARHYTAANACTPSRASLITGLYSHQTGVLVTQLDDSEPTLDPRFPTWGRALRERGYRTSWFGKWHLSLGKTLETHGFGGGTFPDPEGQAGEGLKADPGIVSQFEGWLGREGNKGPWCTTISLVNPHDIAWYPRGSRRTAEERDPPRVFTQLPANFETPAQLRQHDKPREQLAFQVFADAAFGVMRFNGPGAKEAWLRMLDLYLFVQQQADKQLGRVLDILARSPNVERRTVVVLTSDHGEYGGSHGLRGKSGAAYEEAIRIPLIVKDFTGRFVRQPETDRLQLTSSVDVFGLLLSLAEGEAWRKDPKLTHLAGRHDLAALLREPEAPGRAFVLHTTDEPWIQQIPPTRALKNLAAHIVAYRTPVAKLVLYRRWKPGTLDPVSADGETELYDYSTESGRLELSNVYKTNPALLKRLTDELQEVFANELRAELPDSLQVVRQAAVRNYQNFLKQMNS
ncbi:MAG: sulfatase-like hydrolase/transferase [Gemmatimonadaceae bacterium]|nr:sulfatase-like hydrolase/transferase [Gloeobacterales cyanobacterium ES-bin-141]